VLTAGVSIALFPYANSLEELGAAMLLARNGLCLFLFSRLVPRPWAARGGCEYSRRTR
jgi:hypothetical protein